MKHAIKLTAVAAILVAVAVLGWQRINDPYADVTACPMYAPDLTANIRACYAHGFVDEAGVPVCPSSFEKRHRYEGDLLCVRVPS